MSRLLLINGPNLNLLGNREPSIYGQQGFTEIVESSTLKAATLGHELLHFQSNHEGELIDRIQQATHEGIAFIILNPAAYTHTSIALRDALLAAKIPFIEIHLSNVHAREPFRHQSFFSDIAHGVISGFGALGYELAIEAAAKAIVDNHSAL